MDNDLANAAQLAQGIDPNGALPLIEKMLAADPGNPDALTLRGIVAQRTGDVTRAIEFFTAAYTSDPGNPARAVNLGLALKAARRFDEAVKMLSESVAVRPNHAPSLANLGSCLIAAGRAEEAVHVLQKAVRLAPGSADAANNLGVALIRMGEQDAAIAAYRKALTIKPLFNEARLNLADALRMSGECEEAERHARTVLQAQAGHPRAANLLGMLVEQAGDREGAIQVWKHSLQSAGATHPVGVNLMRALMVSGRPDEVQPIVGELLRLNPQSTTPLAYRDAALYAAGRIGELDALRNLARFLRIVDLDAPEGFPSLDAFHAALRAEICSHPSLTYEPDGLVTRKGRQSGDLAEAKSPALAAMGGCIEAALGEFWSDLGRMPTDHPFTAARPAQWTVTTWATILQAGGAVEPHVHAPNWLSGVYYPGFVQGGDGAADGAFAIGVLPDALGGGGHIKVIRPRSGRMILFPSFLWHGTLPFAGEDERISIAFDLVPAGIGRPHRLTNARGD